MCCCASLMFLILNPVRILRFNYGYGPDTHRVRTQATSCSSSAKFVQEAVSRLFGQPPEPEVDDNGESFISVSVRSDMDLVTTSSTPDPSPGSFAGCVPQILPMASRTAPLAALPTSSVHKLKPGNSCLVRCPKGKDHSKDYANLPPFSYDTVRLSATAVAFVFLSRI